MVVSLRAISEEKSHEDQYKIKIINNINTINEENIYEENFIPSSGTGFEPRAPCQ